MCTSVGTLKAWRRGGRVACAPVSWTLTSCAHAVSCCASPDIAFEDLLCRWCCDLLEKAFSFWREWLDVSLIVFVFSLSKSLHECHVFCFEKGRSFATLRFVAEQCWKSCWNDSELFYTPSLVRSTCQFLLFVQYWHCKSIAHFAPSWKLQLKPFCSL